jgi:lysyl-tRNA synthetase, class II
MNTPKSTLAQIRQIRIEKANKLRAMGINPYPAKSFRNENIKPIVQDYESFEDKEVTLAGRIMSWREHGHLIFANLQDPTGTIQLYIKDDILKTTKAAEDNIGFGDLNLLDVGDIIEATGTITKTQRGEISLLPTTIRVLTKAIRPLPDKWKGIEDKEIRFRRRYLDFIMDPDKKEIFARKAKFYHFSRKFLLENDFLEVEVPVLESITGGADARPFVTYHNDLDQELFMRISTELYQKRLNGGGFGKIFTLGPNFRNEGVDDEHLQEYYQIEWYWPYANYQDNMALTRDLFRYVAQNVYHTTKFTARGHSFDLADEWKEIDYVEVIKEKHGIDIFASTDEQMLKVAESKGLKLDGQINRMRLIDNLWKLVRKEISGPAFLLNEPKFMSPLSKSKTDNPELTERFHIIIAGSELGNGYSELNDPIDQLERFKEQQSARDEGDDEAQMLDIDFVEMLEYGMPPNSGFGMSERVFWFFEDLSAREATLFPQMKFDLENTTKEIYGLEEPKDKSQNPKPISSSQQNNINALDSSQTPHAPIDKICDTQDTINKHKQDISKKIVIIVNKELENWKVLNTIGHISANLGHKIGADFYSGPEFETKDGQTLGRSCRYPVVILSAKPGQFVNLRNKIIEDTELNHFEFCKEHLEIEKDEDIKKVLKDKGIDEIEYYGIGIQGPVDKLDQLTKKFSLWK